MSDGTGFIVAGAFRDFPDADRVICFECRFEPSRFTDDLFGRLGVDLPAKLDKAAAKRRAEFLAGRYAARRALSRLGLTTQVPVGDAREALWPDGIVGSISHTSRVAICALSRDAAITGIGIDVEDIVKPDVVSKIDSGVLSPTEVGRLARIALPYPTAFTIAFSVKESFFKSVYATVRRYLGFGAVSVTRISVDGDGGTVDLVPSQDLAVLVGSRVSGRWTLADGAITTAVLLH